MKEKMYWRLESNDDSIDFDLWFRYNFTSTIIPRECLNINQKLFHGKVNTEVQSQK